MTPQYSKVDGNPNLVRDEKTRAIINVNRDALVGYKRQREERRKMARVVVEHDELIRHVTTLDAKIDKILAILGAQV